MSTMWKLFGRAPVTSENNLLFPVSMSKAIFKLNLSYDSTMPKDSIFMNPKLIVSIMIKWMS